MTSDKIRKASAFDLRQEGWKVVSEESAETLAGRYGVHVFGTYNQPPKSMREITEAEFVEANDLHNYGDVINRFVQYRFNGELLSAVVHVNAFGKGWFFYPDYREKKVRFFRFEACEHKYKTVRASMCYREYVCEKCGMKHEVDSSD